MLGLVRKAEGASQVALVVKKKKKKNLPANAGDVRGMSLILASGNPLEEGTATRCSILAWRISWADDPGRLWSIGSLRVKYN